MKKSRLSKSSRSFWERRRVLITGGCGYLGTELVRNLVNLGSQITIIDRVKRKDWAGGSKLPGVDLISRDLGDINFLRDVLKTKNVQTIIHLAAQSGVPESHADPAAAFKANVELTWAVLEACRIYGKISEIVHVSSNHIYGKQKQRPTPEDASLNGTGVYATYKACSDLIARCYAKSFGLPVGVARLTNTFGEYDPHSKHIVTYTINKVLKRERPVIKGNGLDSKGFLFIQDTIGAIKLLAEKINKLNLGGEAFNFVPDKPVKIIDLVKKIIELSGKTDLEPIILGKLTDPHEEEWLSNKKAKKILGWKPKYTLGEGLKKTLTFYLRRLKYAKN